MPLAPELTDLRLEELRERSSAKWSYYGADVLPSWVAEMDFPLAPPIADALGGAVDRGDVGYANAAASNLATAFAGFAERRMGWRVDPEQVIACTDVVGGLRDLLRVLLEPGAGVVITPPVYHPFFSLVPEAGCSLVEVPLLGGRDLDLDGIVAAFAAGARAMMLCNPHNPTGAVVSREELERLAEIAAEYDGWILSDEIHAPLTLPGAEHVPFLGVSEHAAARGVALVSASKAFNLAGLGCALIVTTGEAARAAVDPLPLSARHPGHLGVIAAEAAFEAGDEWLDSVIQVLDENRRAIAEQLLRELPEVAYVQPMAGYLAWLDLAQLELGADPAPRILERGRLALSPGPQFGSGGEGHVRLNFGTSPALVAEAIDRIAQGGAMTDPVDAALLPWWRSMKAAFGPLELFDAHTHVGQNDPDGFHQTPAELLEALDPIGARAAFFAMHEPERLPRGQRRRARGSREERRQARSVLPRQPARRGGHRSEALPRRRRSRDQAAPARRGLHAGRAGHSRARCARP